MIYKMNLMCWEVFFSLMHTGSSTETANELNRNGADVSKIIRALEKDLGTDLFDRSSRPFKPTQTALKLAESLFPFYSGFRDTVESVGQENRGVLFRVSAPIDLATRYIPQQLMAYSQMHRNVRIELKLSTELRAVREGSIDAALLQRPGDISGLTVRPCITSTCCPLASTEYLKNFGIPKNPNDLVRHTGLLMRWNNGAPTSFLYDKHGQSSPMLRWRNIFIADNQITLKHLALQHWGITLDLSASNAIEEIRKGQLVPILTDWSRENWELCVITRTDKENSNIELKHFAEWWAARERSDSMSRVSAGLKAVEEAIEKAQ